MQIGSDNNNNDGSQTLLAMAEYDWITYLTSNRMPEAIKYALLANPYILQIFGDKDSISTYRRDDSTVQSLPSISIYEDIQDTPSRFYSDKGQIRFDIFLPIRLSREDNAAVIKTIGQAFKNILQSPHFWGNLNDKLVPLPELISPIYNDVVNYKEKYGSPLVEFAKNCKFISPLKPSLTDIGDAWRLDLITDYYFDMSNYYAMLEDFGIEGKVDPNKIVYQILRDFSVDVQPISSF